MGQGAQQQIKERKQNKNEMHHHNLRVSKNRNEPLSYMENIEQQAQSSKEFWTSNEANNSKRVPTEKQRFKDKVSTSNRGYYQERGSIVRDYTPIDPHKLPLKQVTSNIKEKVASLTNKAQELDILKVKMGNGPQNPEPGPPDSIDELIGVSVVQVQDIVVLTSDKLNQEIFIECIYEVIQKSLFDDEVIRRGTGNPHSEESLYLRDKELTNISNINNMSPRN